MRTASREAHYQVARAIAASDLPRPSNYHCVDCKAPATQYDHRDYSKPLEVEPVCRRCNLRRGPAIGSHAYKRTGIEQMAALLAQPANTPERS